MKRLIRAILIIVALGALLVGCLFGFLVSQLTQPAGESNIAIAFIVEPNQTIASVSSNLEDEGLINQALLFRILARMRDNPEIHPGTYYFSPSMTMNQILADLIVAPEAVESVRVIIPEGLRLEEIAAKVAEDTGFINTTEYLELARNAEMFRADYTFLADVPPGATLEGFLFPDTYDFFTDATAEDIIRKQLDTFAERLKSVEQSSATSGRTIYEIVTMASIIEREAANMEEMPRIGAAFWNRLRPEFAGQLLGADPTVQYIIGTEGNWWPKELTLDDLAVDNPYNTRIYPGLPPGPISAPGLAALQGAAAPADEDITYFVAECVPEGQKPTHKFASTYEEFLIYQEEYLQCAK